MKETLEFESVSDAEVKGIIEDMGISQSQIAKLKKTIEKTKISETMIGYKGISKASRELGVSKDTILTVIWLIGL